MKIPKKVLINIAQRLKFMSEEELNQRLNRYQGQLNALVKTSKKNYVDYESTPIQQHIRLIENELQRRQGLVVENEELVETCSTLF